MLFRQFQPSEALAPYIRSYWMLEHDIMSDTPEIILPDGCTEMVLHYGDRYVSHIAGQRLVQSQAVVVGQIRQAITLQALGRTGIFAIRFQPWGLYAFTGMPMQQLTDLAVDAESIWGKELALVREQVYYATTDDKVKVIEQFLLGILRKQHRTVTSKANFISSVLQPMQHHKGNIPIAHLAYHAHTSVRNFNRIVTETTGIAPKLLARITRLQSFLNIHSPGNTLTDSLYKCGYYDQAHFIREFKEIAGTTPNRFFSDDNTMAELMLQ